MILFNGGGNDTRHTDSVAAHVQRGRLARDIEHGGAHGLAVLLAQLEYVADLDTARDGQRSLARGAGIARHHLAQVGRGSFGQVAAPVHAREVRILLVRADDEVGQSQHRVIGVEAALETHRSDEARLRARGLDGLVGRHADGLGHARELRGLDLVEFMIATHQESDQSVIAVVHQRLHQLRGG